MGKFSELDIELQEIKQRIAKDKVWSLQELINDERSGNIDPEGKINALLGQVWEELEKSI